MGATTSLGIVRHPGPRGNCEKRGAEGAYACPKTGKVAPPRRRRRKRGRRVSNVDKVQNARAEVAYSAGVDPSSLWRAIVKRLTSMAGKPIGNTTYS